MSIAGIDIGSGSVKISVYSYEGNCIASAGDKLTSQYPKPGYWEIDPKEVWEKTLRIIGRVANMKRVKNDPPEVLSISASGREVFPVDKHGEALGPCIMAGDIRDYGVDIANKLVPGLQTWINDCGHLPERMDPVCRILWWKENHPSVVLKTSHFLGWHEFMTLKLCGRPVTDRSLAGKWLIYDLQKHSWSDKYMDLFGIGKNVLPEISDWGEIIGELDARIATVTGLPRSVKVAVGGFDACCSALGAGVITPGTGCLLSGTWENLIIPVNKAVRSAEFCSKGIFYGPYPSESSMALFCLNPNGNSAVKWASDLTDSDIRKSDIINYRSIDEPSSVLALPFFSRTPVPFGSAASGASLLGLSLSTTSYDIIKALMESIAFNLAISVSEIKELGISVDKLRAGGGGTHSEWWTQLKSDLMKLPVEITNQKETGTSGAAILAGFAAGIFRDIETGVKNFVKVEGCYLPDQNRFDIYKPKLSLYKEVTESMNVVFDRINRK